MRKFACLFDVNSLSSSLSDFSDILSASIADADDTFMEWWGVQDQKDDAILEYVLLGDWNLVYSQRMSSTILCPTPTQSSRLNLVSQVEILVFSPKSS